MTELLTAAQMRAIEQAAIDSGEVTGLELMERAGRGVVEAIFEEWPELADGADGGPAPQAPRGISEQKKHRSVVQRAVVLCGPGNNGGDGFVVARLLYERGWAVEVFLYGDAERLPPDARVNYERWGQMGEVIRIGEEPHWDSLPFVQPTHLFIDALFGTGLTRPLEGNLRSILFNLNADGDVVQWRPALPKFVSVDIASGFCADSGRVLGAFAPSDLTVTFHTEKLGHRLDGCPNFTGRIKIVDIGLSRDPHKVAVRKTGGDFLAVGPVELLSGQIRRFSMSAYNSGNWLGKDETRKSQADWPRGLHKFDHGHALILSGGAGKTGATRLAARGALRIGAGLVTLGVPGAAQMEVASQITALMLRRVDDGAALAETLQDDRLNALCLGPGLGLSDERAALTEAALKSGRATVLDADALTMIAQSPALFALLHERCVLTPHQGEFARLFPDIAKRLSEEPMSGPAYSKVDATREAARRVGCTVLFKGPDTVIADPSGRCSINSAHYNREAPWLATAGSGDVLAGFITGLLARGFAPMQAAETGAWLHVECARSFGPGLVAEDLPEELPKVFRAMGV